MPQPPFTHDQARALLRAIPDNGRTSGLMLTWNEDLYVIWAPHAFEVLWDNTTPFVEERVPNRHKPNPGNQKGE